MASPTVEVLQMEVARLRGEQQAINTYYQRSFAWFSHELNAASVQLKGVQEENSRLRCQVAYMRGYMAREKQNTKNIGGCSACVSVLNESSSY
jgi:hypothetical protein